ncbi:MAG: hypothetical protein EPN89_09490 [Methylovulum sp.]|jgi:hypothetical protein|nr:MAG: hypothetical protein EPN89_09490 [Methylovulum sp.]
MKKILFFALLLAGINAFADDAKNEWHNTVLSDATIEKIQQAKYQYKKCVSDEMQKPVYQEQDTRRATDGIMNQCEPVLAKMREVYIAEKVPAIVADRHLKQMRIQTTRSALQGMMFSEAARKAAQ